MLYTQDNTKNNLYFYRIKQFDTIYSIATNVLESADKFYIIALYNNLEPPYIVSETTPTQIKAQGQGKFLRKSISGDITIPVGTIIYANADSFTPYIRQYETLTATELTGSNIETALIDIIAVDYGEKYNILENKIENVADPLATQHPELSFINPEPILNAKDKKLKKPGEYLVIPANQISNFNIKELQPANTFYDLSVLGADIQLLDGDILPSAEYTVASADIKTVQGVDNIKQALVHKLITYKGSLRGHPEYGSILPYLIGSFSGSYLSAMAKVETTRTLLTDPRVTEVESVNILQRSNYIEIDFTVKVIGNETHISDNLVFQQPK